MNDDYVTRNTPNMLSEKRFTNTLQLTLSDARNSQKLFQDLSPSKNRKARVQQNKSKSTKTKHNGTI